MQEGEAQLTFFGGVQKSGGVQVLFSKGKQAVMFDFGIEHSSLLFPKQLTLYEPVGATPGRELRQYLLGGMTAPLFNLYDPAQMEGLDRQKIEQAWNLQELPQYEQIQLFVGHAHTDHIALLPYARPDLDVYMNHDTYALFRGMVAGKHIDDTKAKIHAYDDLSVIDFGEFTIQIIEMDHNATGAAGLLIDDGTYKVAYTGDWRKHGKHPEKIERFIQLCSEEQIDVLITEGTRLRPLEEEVSTQMEEDALLLRFSEIIAGAGGLVYLQMSPRDLERMANMMAIASEKGRDIVMEASHAAIWQAANEAGVAILEDHPAHRVQIHVLAETVSAGLSTSYPTITLEEIAEQKNKFIYFFKFPDLAHMIEIETLGNPAASSHFIQSDYSVKLGHRDIAKFLSAFQIEGHTLSNGGHAHPDAISDMVERIAPKTVVTLHSRFPESLDTKGVHAYFPTKGQTITLSSLIKNK